MKLQLHFYTYNCLSLFCHVDPMILVLAEGSEISKQNFSLQFIGSPFDILEQGGRWLLVY